MKFKFSAWILILIPICLLTSCKKAYVVDFRINNDASEGISVILQKTAASDLDTSYISAGQYFKIHTESAENSTAEKYIFSLEELPFHFLEIRNSLNSEMLCNENSLECWTRIGSNGAKEYGFVTLKVRDQSF